MAKRLLGTVSVILAVLALLYLVGRPSPDSADPRVDALFAEWARPDSPGCAVGASRNGEVVLERGYGMANLELGVAITPASVFPVASISKQFTAFSILLLAQRRQISLDDEVRKYITELPDYGTPLTIRHLLTHTSGLRDAFLLDGWAAPWQGSDPNDAIVRMLARQRGLNFAPGTQYQYNNGGYNLLAHIVRRVTGQSLRVFAQENIFGPLGMTSTQIDDDPEMIVPNRVSGYWRDAKGLRAGSSAPGIVGNGGVLSTVRDLLRWERNLADVRVGDPSLVAEMQTPAVLANGEKSAYGFGLSSGEYRGTRIVEHGGGDRGMATYFIRYPEHGLGIAVLCNADFIPAGIPLALGVADVYLADVLAAPAAGTTVPAPVEVALPAEQLARHAAWYRHASGTLLRVFVREGRLHLTEPEGGGEEYALTAIGEHRLVLLSNGAVANRLEFVPEQAGGAAQLRSFGLVEGAAAEVFDRVSGAAPSESDLERFAGNYRSDELDVTYTVAVRAPGLVLHPVGRPDMVIEPVDADLFAGAIAGTVRFSRGPQGAIDGFTMTRTMARDVGFTRVR